MGIAENTGQDVVSGVGSCKIGLVMAGGFQGGLVIRLGA